MATKVQAPAKRRTVRVWRKLGTHYKAVSKLHLRQLFADDPDRLIIIDPEHNPSLNMLDVTTEYCGMYESAELSPPGEPYDDSLLHE